MEIVAAKIGTIITNRRKDIIYAITYDCPVVFLSRLQMEFMSACDLGPHWDALAKGPALFDTDMLEIKNPSHSRNGNG